MNDSTAQIAVLLGRIRDHLWGAVDLVRPESEYLLDELEPLIEQVDILRGKVEEEGRILRDKEVLVGESRTPVPELPPRNTP
jgi:hypothetical protein